jgi:hypothetical protein
LIGLQICFVKENTMSEPVRKSAVQEQRKQKVRTHTGVERILGFTIVAAAVAVLAVLGAAALFAQGQDKDKYLLKSPSGIAFSDFRGYEDWADVSSARTTEILKVIVANPTMIKAYKAGIPANGQPFPEGSKIVKLQWTQKKSTEAPFAVDEPGVRDGKGQQEICEKWRVGIRSVQLRCRFGQVHGRCQKSLRLRIRVPYAGEGEGLHFPPVRKALNLGCKIRMVEAEGQLLWLRAV